MCRNMEGGGMGEWKMVGMFWVFFVVVGNVSALVLFFRNFQNNLEHF